MTSALAKYISAFFHPIIYPTLSVLLYFVTIPKYFSIQIRLSILIITFVGTVVIPVFLLALLKYNGLIDSYSIPKAVGRRFPFLIIIIIALLMGRLFFRMQVTADFGYYFVSGALALSICYIFLWWGVKLSVHTMSLGSVLGFFMFLSVYYQLNFLLLFALFFLMFGVIARARLVLKAHTISELLWGFFLGTTTQLLLPLLLQKI
ncbi:MAG: hypothetical protein CSA40_00070 [Flavobacteriales bacterium]|nr:MAG: hypothetical protein CSA40_00070 [Flavobacteriales bacterium]